MVTGSSSKMLRDDISAALRGKAVSSTVYPLSFSEFLRFKKSRANAASTTGQAELHARFDDYLKWGGYPALPNTPAHSREALLRGYFDRMILKDIVQRKIYAIDWALAIRNSRVWDGSYSRAFENMVYLHLLRNYPRVRYYLTRTRRQEVDFLVSDAQGKPVLAIQVSQDISLPDTLRREVEPLIATARHFGTKKNLILTVSQEQRIESEGVTVQALPVWRWLRSEKMK